MSTSLTLFDQPVPAAIQAAFGELSNIPEKQSTPQLSFRGKVFRVVMDGEENVVKNSAGDPVQSVRVIVLKINSDRSRAYFEGQYEEGKSQTPICWSNDGKTPDASIAEPQAQSCAACPQAAKGSKVSDSGKAMAACGTFRRVAIVPTANLDHEPLLLKIPQTSIWDKDNAENEKTGFYAFDQYLDFLRKRGVNHTGAVMTKIKFDPRPSYPKLLFGADNWTPTDWHPKIKALIDDPRLDTLINTTAFEAAVRATPAAAAPADDEPVMPTKAAVAAPAVTKTVPPPTAKRAPPPPKKAAPKPAEPDDEAVMPSKGNGKAAPAVIDAETGEVETAAPAADKAGLNTLLQGWD
jgi:hypothetical protein